MPDIKDSVGDGGTNNVHDVALVQLMLRQVKNAKGASYFATDYTGSYTDDVKNATIAFQKDQGLLPALPPGAKPPAGAEKAGLVDTGSQTLAKLNAALPAKYATATIIADTKTIYLEMDTAAATASAKSVNGTTDLDATFRANVVNLVNEVFKQQKIVLTVAPKGGNRSFSAQAGLSPGTTGAGPGESNHNWGRAVDIGFNHLKWVKGNGDIFEEDWWLAKDAMPSAKQQAFWDARNTIANGFSLFPTTRPGDLIHLQAFDDTNVNMANSLAALLNIVTTKNMKWQAVQTSPRTYKNDFGLGGAKFGVGNAKQIFAGSAPVTKADVVKALNAKLTADKTFNVYKFFGVTPLPKGAPPAAPMKEADIKADYIATIQSNMQADFGAAETNVSKWKPLP